MDDHRFDDLTRALIQPLPRRRLLQRAASVLGGAILAGWLGRNRVGAITCTNGGAECDGRCCDPGWECLGQEPNRICSAPCEGEAGRCGVGCCAGVCCDGGSKCCPANSTCCPQTIGGYGCCAPGQECVPLGNGQNHCFGCQEDSTKCGAANCCAPGFVCVEGPNAGDGACIPCPAGHTKCGAKNCCASGEICGEDGECVAACPAGRAARRGVAAEAECEPCSAGTVQCGGACVLECKAGRIMNVDTCACECEGQPCGAECCPAEQECTFHGDDERSPRCCLKGQSCGLYCKGDPKIRCCKTGPFPVSISCDARTQVCKGGGCRRKRRRSRRKK